MVEKVAVSEEHYLTKSRYIDGLRCRKKLWLGVREPLSHEDPAPYSNLDVGNRVGKGAHQLFPGGVEVTEKPWEHAEAVNKTRALVLDPGVPAIFEAAFEHEGVRVRVDVLERLPGSAWGIREVKASTEVREDKFHIDDVAVQLHIVRGEGLDVTSVELVHVDRGYVRGVGGVEWPLFLARADVTREATTRLTSVSSEVSSMFETIGAEEAPGIYATKSLCGNPYRCGYWNQCMREKPANWVGCLPGLHENKLSVLHARGVESIEDIPEDFKLSERQLVARDVVVRSRPYISKDLGSSMAGFGPPAYYMDFETMNAGIPIYPGTRPYGKIPFQWSLHQVDKGGVLHHQWFLADGSVNPSRKFAESLVRAIDLPGMPVVVYNQAFEAQVLKALSKEFPDLAESLSEINSRIVDLLPVVRENVNHPGFFSLGSLNSSAYSLKNVLPVLVPSMSYDSPGGISEGNEASRAFTALVCGENSPSEAGLIRQQLLDYCKQDTLAMVEIHRTLKQGNKRNLAE